MLPFTRNQDITYTNCEVSRLKDGKEKLNELLSKSHVIVGKLSNDEDDGKENGKRVIRLDLPFLFHNTVEWHLPAQTPFPYIKTKCCSTKEIDK